MELSYFLADKLLRNSVVNISIIRFVLFLSMYTINKILQFMGLPLQLIPKLYLECFVRRDFLTAFVL